MSTAPADRSLHPSALPAWHWGEEGSIPAQRRLLVVATVCIVVFMLLALTSFLWREHQVALDKSGERAARLGQGLARDLEQTLTVARTVINEVEIQLQPAPEARWSSDAMAKPDSFSTLLSSLPLPFNLHAIEAQGRSIAILGSLAHPPMGGQDHPHPPGEQLDADRWMLSTGYRISEGQIVPLAWKAAANPKGVKGYGVDLSLVALNAWLDGERIEPNDRASLFWMNSDGTATLLARAPAVSTEMGARVKAPWVEQANLAATGMADQLSALDGVPRLAAFHRLSGPASNLVVVYGAGTQVALAEWRSKLPYFIGLALFLITAMCYGAWRLDRSLLALTQGERHLQLMLDSGNVWDWDIGNKTVRYSPMFLQQLGFEPVPPERMASTMFKAVHPDDIGKLKEALISHLKERKPYALTFRLRDSRGQTRWFDTKGQAFWDASGRAQYMSGTTFEITERVTLEATQRQTLQRLDMVTNASTVLFWTSDLQGQVNWVNRRWLAFTGRTLEQELGHGWLEGIHPDDRAKRQAFYELAPSREEAVSAELRLRDKDGHYRWMVVQCRPMKDSDLGVTGLIGSCVDVSDLKQAEDAARQRGAMLETVFNVLEDLLFVVDDDGRFIHFQGSADEQLYVPPEVFLGKLLRDVMPGPIADLLHDKLTLARNGQLQEFDYLLPLPDGEHHFEARMAQLPATGHYMVVARDITERDRLRQHSERMQRFMTLQARLATNFINLPIADIGAGIDHALAEIGHFAPTDRAYIFEYDFASHQTSNTHEWCAPGVKSELDNLQNIDLDLIPEWVQAHLANQMVLVPDLSAMRAGKLKVLLSAQGIRSLITLPMFSAEGCIGFVGFDAVLAPHQYDEEQIGLLQQFAQMLVNVYGRMAADTRLRRLASELEQRVQERTAQLDQSVRRLSEVNKELESFAYSVSHDLKAPLRSVEGFASLLLEEHSASLNEEGRDYLARIQGASLHMARLISDLLAYCRMENLDKGIAAVSLGKVASEVIGGMRNELDTRGARVQVDIPADLSALGNPEGLAMVLRNLIDNAVKFARPGIPPEITLTARPVDSHVHLCVKDNGQGFDMRYHDRIFALFQRLHRPDAISGTGIGLAMVLKAVQRMNGRIWADSKPGEGAKFHIELPRA
jgi:PAS domain S-box-containing protein